jgi:hypothetical protein
MHEMLKGLILTVLFFLSLGMMMAAYAYVPAV